MGTKFTVCPLHLRICFCMDFVFKTVDQKQINHFRVLVCHVGSSHIISFESVQVSASENNVQFFVSFFVSFFFVFSCLLGFLCLFWCWFCFVLYYLLFFLTYCFIKFFLYFILEFQSTPTKPGHQFHVLSCCLNLRCNNLK